MTELLRVVVVLSPFSGVPVQALAHAFAVDERTKAARLQRVGSTVGLSISTWAAGADRLAASR